MSSNIDNYKSDLSNLVKLGEAMYLDLTYSNSEKKEKLSEGRKKLLDELSGTFERQYQRWYSESYEVIRQLLPARLSEFEVLYKGDGRRKNVDLITFTIQDWLMGVRAIPNRITAEKPFDDFSAATMRFHTQRGILKAVEARFESSLFDIRQLVQADLFDSELETARELTRNGFLRGAGAIAGVVIEKHLAQVCANHKLTTRKKNPTVNDFNEQLKDKKVIDIPAWRFIQRLGDLRNLCDHNKEREPTRDEVTELIDGVEKVTKTMF